MFETGERALIHQEAGYDFLIDTGWLYSVERVIVKRGRLEAVVYLFEDDVRFYDDSTPFNEAESRRVLELVEDNFDDLRRDFWNMVEDWKRGRLRERWGVDDPDPSLDDLFEEESRSSHADLE